LVPSLAAVDTGTTEAGSEELTVHTRGVIGTIACRGTMTTDISVATRHTLCCQSMTSHSQSTFHMRRTKRHSFPCSETPFTNREPHHSRTLARTEGLKLRGVIGRPKPHRHLSPCVHTQCLLRARPLLIQSPESDMRPHSSYWLLQPLLPETHRRSYQTYLCTIITRWVAPTCSHRER
jgi:hypothetical protein